MAFDYKKEYKEFYLPKSKPGLVTVPAMKEIPTKRAEITRQRWDFCMGLRLRSR